MEPELYPITYITDCFDGNARARLSTRIGALFGQSPTIVAADGPDPESFAALTLLDCLVATSSLGEDGHPTITLLNIAPRDGVWPNGVPFCFFHHGKHLVASTFNARVLSLVRRELGVEHVYVTDIRDAVTAAGFGADEIEKIAGTQFRSLWYLPLLAKWVADGRPVPAVETAVPEVLDADPVVTIVDNFGNCKLDRRLEPDFGSTLPVARRNDDGSTTVVEVACYPHLTAVPRNAPGIVPGSSGSGFTELVIRGGSAAAAFGLRPGDTLLEPVEANVA
ncbi:SAM hydroxide adenosyltransferase [Kribbella sp. HUAS MG21]|uniref:SAM hydroxide adenosyltransferase n=1 Tax=Kribbella sp. HUAS MG21 TaxID=3160966 RepID=A0AAU7TF38_9ACTN